MAITVRQARKVLGKSQRDTSDDHIQNLLNQFYSLAEIISETVVSNGSKKTTRGIDLSKKEEQNGTRR